MVGRYFEDFVVGEVIRHPLGRTISETDNTWFTLLTLNSNQMHFNADYAAKSMYGKVLVNSGLTICLVLGLTVSELSQNAAANLGFDEVRLPHPVFVGDTLYAESRVLDARESKSRLTTGIVSAYSRGLNQAGDTVVSWRRSFMVLRRDAPQDKGVFPEPKQPMPA